MLNLGNFTNYLEGLLDTHVFSADDYLLIINNQLYLQHDNDLYILKEGKGFEKISE